VKAGNLSKVVARSAAEVARLVELEEEAGAMLRPGMTPAQYLEALVGASLFPDAVKFLAAALPKRESVWWACVCSRLALPPDSPPPVVQALVAAEKWVYEPTEPNRRAAEAAGEATGFASPPSCAATAAFWSGPSIAAPDSPAPVPPAEGLAARGVAGAVMLAAVQKDPELAEEKYRRFLERGVDIANGGTGQGQPKR
jgi:hypothetical protein